MAKHNGEQKFEKEKTFQCAHRYDCVQNTKEYVYVYIFCINYEEQNELQKKNEKGKRLQKYVKKKELKEEEEKNN